MDSIKLIFPALEQESAAESFRREFFDHGEAVINGSALFDQMQFAEWLENTQNNSHPDTVRADWVTAHTFFVVRESDEQIIGMIDVRHNLDNEFLAEYGGHIGYSVRPSERRKGYATDMLRKALAFAKQLGLAKVMLGCYSDNLASKKTIEKCGGRLADVKPYLDGKMMDVYWIAL